jgi:Icc-related predicted phosphoesterase
MLICFTSDLHGRLELFEQLTELLRTAGPDVLILGGDIHADAEPADTAAVQLAFIEHELGPRIDLWRELVPGLAVLTLLGNHDVGCTAAALQRQQDVGRLVLLDHRHVVERGGVRFLGLAATPPSPHWAKDFERLDEPGDELPREGGYVWDGAAGRLRPVSGAAHFGGLPTLADELGAAPAAAAPWIFVCHAPPADSKLDRLPHIDYPIGSRAVRKFIERSGPLCSLHGHVHESPEVTGAYVDRVGRTLCVNPGQTHERLHAVLFAADQPAETLRHTVYG